MLIDAQFHISLQFLISNVFNKFDVYVMNQIQTCDEFLCSTVFKSTCNICIRALYWFESSMQVSL